MTVATNDFEGGSSGSTITTGNSGGTGQNAFNSVVASTLVTPNSPTFDNTHTRGSLAAKFNTGATAAQQFVSWTTAVGTLTTDFYARLYIYITAAPPANIRMLTAHEGSSLHAGLNLTSGGGVRLLSSSAAAIGTELALDLNAWNRVEVKFPMGATSTLELRTHKGANLDTTTVTGSTTGTNVAGRTQVDTYRLGHSIAGTATNYSWWADDLAMGDNGAYLGPAPAGIPLTNFGRPASTVAAGGWLPVGAATLHAASSETVPNDASYEESPFATTTPATSEVTLNAVTDPVSATGHVVRYRYAKDVAGGDRVDLTVSLWQGTSFEIASWTHQNIGTITTAEQTLTAAQANSITDYTTLRRKLSAVKV
jgi:hypothetical protein